ncbi:MAG: carboxypeptidase regulatory-like domain-containing protein [Acidobacteriia bacterium]|nr:carboxypeptidase regulatory-like domain-containing protein [Terriglobia bacterium]
MKFLTRILGLVLLVAAASLAQDITGSIAGTVTDPSGAGVPNAKITVTNTDRNAVIRTVTTDSGGNYSAPLLPIGTYSLAVTAAGFKTSNRTGISLDVNDKLTLNIGMQVGQLTESVTVEASAVEVALQTATASNLINGTQIRELSLNNRNYEQLVALMPGVSSGASDQLYIGTTNPLGTNTVSFAINGQRNSANYWTVDGADNVDRGSNLTLLNYPSVDALAEFKVLRGLYTAEFGRAGGGQINVVTKSGTSAFHGSAYEFFRNDKIAANNWINNANKVNLGTDGKARVPPLRYNDFGYTIGGPIYIPGHFNKDKNKTFFFFSQEYRRVITYATVTALVPTAAEKQGIFAGPVCVNNTGSTCNVTTTQIANINPVAAAYIKDIFSTIPAGSPLDHSLPVSQRNTYNARQDLVRIDHTFNEKFSVWGRVLNDSIPTIEPGGLFTASPLPNVATTSTNSPGRTWVFHGLYTIRPNLVNDGGYNKSYGAITSDTIGQGATTLSPDIKATLPFPVTLGRVPSISFTGGSGIAGFGPYRDYNRNHAAYDNLTWIKGRHTMKFGASVNHYQKSENAGGNNVGSFTFASTAAPAGTPSFAQSWANFLLGNTSSFTQASLDLTPDIRTWQWEAYVQDDFRLRPNLTISVGLRYSLFRQPIDAKNELTNFNPGLWKASDAPQIDSAGNLVAGTGNLQNGLMVNGQNSPFGDKVANESTKDFAPRLGIAWDPFGKGKTSVRAGYGIYYDAMLFGVYEQNIFNNIPFVQTVTIPNTRLENPAAGTPSISLAPKVIRGTPMPYLTPYTQQWSLGIQQEIGRNFVLDVSYVGTKGTHLLGIVDINEVPVGAGLAAGLHTGAGTAFTSADTPKLNALRPYRGYNVINTLESAFDSNYHSLQVSLDKRLGAAGTFGLSYTWSHNLTDNQSDRSNAPQNSYNWHNGEYGPASLDRRQIVTFNYVYELPFFKNAKGAERFVLGGWQVSGTAQIGSGQPLTATTASVDPGGLGILGSSVAGPRPDMICDPNKGAPHTITQWFNTACFADVPAGVVRPGNAGRGTILGPGFQNWNISLFKNFNFTERWKFQLRGESFNFVNHPNPNAPTVGITSSLYGKITGFHDPRIIQLGAKLYF